MKLKTLKNILMESKFRIRAKDGSYFDVDYFCSENDNLIRYLLCMDCKVKFISYNKAIEMMEIKIDLDTFEN